MSVIGGIWNFDGKPVDRRWLENLGTALVQYGPDGEFFYINGPVGIVYRPFHTTAESRQEQQPWISPAGNVIAWDGRLDNADDLRHDLGFPFSVIAERGEAALALLAFERWGKSGLTRLIGDFAFSIWQPQCRRLLLGRDAFAIRPMFYHVTKGCIFWCSDLTQLICQRGMQWTLDDSYIAGYLTRSTAVEETPYREIRGVGAASWVEVSPERVNIGQFWQLEPGKRKDRCKTDADYEEVFRHLFRQSVHRRLRSDKPVLGELSGGMDSSSIVCVADDLLVEEPGLTPQLDTLTYYDASEPTGDEREWAKYVEARRGRTGDHINTAELVSYQAPDPSYFFPVPGATEGTLWIEREYRRITMERGARVVLSGLGGDEFTGAVPQPYAELADMLIEGRWLRFAQLLKQWSIVKKRPAADLAWQCILALAPAAARGRWSVQAKGDAWLQSDFVQRQQIQRRKAGAYHEAWRLLPSHRMGIFVWKCLAADNNHATFFMGPRETRMPFMDRDLVEFLSSIPGEQQLRPGFRRSLIRRALAASVPADIFNRRQKAVAVRGPMTGLTQYLCAATNLGGSFEVACHGYVNGELFWEALRRHAMVRSDNLVGIISVLGLEHWLRNSNAAFSKAGCTLTASHVTAPVPQGLAE